MSLVSFHTSWADMAEPEPNVNAVLLQALGQEGLMELLDEFGQAVRGIESVTLRLRPDLGVNQN